MKRQIHEFVVWFIRGRGAWAMCARWVDCLCVSKAGWEMITVAECGVGILNFLGFWLHREEVDGYFVVMVGAGGVFCL